MIKHQVVDWELKKKLSVNANEYCILDIVIRTVSADGFCYVSMEQIAEIIGTTKMQVMKAICRLEEKGLIMQTAKAKKVPAEIAKLFPVYEGEEKERGICFFVDAYGFKKPYSNSSVDIGVNRYVYLLCDNNEVVYIGASTNRSRISQHKDKQFNEVYFLEAENCFELESNLIKKHLPKYNRAIQ